MSKLLSWCRFVVGVELSCHHRHDTLSAQVPLVCYWLIDKTILILIQNIKKSTTGLTFYQHCTFLQLANKPVVGNLVFTALLIDWWYDWQRRKKLSHAFHSIWYAVHPTKQFNVNQCSSGNFKMKEWMNDVTMIAPSSRHSTDI